MTTQASANLSDLQRRLLDFVRAYITTRGYAPSIREIQRGATISSSSVVSYNLDRLEEAGYLRRQQTGQRALALVEPPTETADLRALLNEAASDLDQLAYQVYDLDRDDLARALTIRAEALRDALHTAGAAP